MRLTWPLTGRTTEVRRIAAAMSDPDSTGVVVRGGAGVGKTRLARDALDALPDRYAVHWIAGTTSAQALPLGALSSWTDPAVLDMLGVIRGLLTSLTSAPAGCVPVLAVDDVAVLDALSTFVVHQIIGRRAAKVVMTVRDDAVIPIVTQELWRDSGLDVVEVAPLSEPDTAALVSAAVGGPLEPQTAARLWQLTRGNPLYLRNIVEPEVAAGRLLPHRGVWRWQGDTLIPPGLVELIEERIGALPTAVSDVIDTLAVAEPIDLRILTRVTSSAAVEDADRRGLITLAGVDHRVDARLAHPLYGEVRRSRAARTTLRRIRALVAHELSVAEDRDDLSVLVKRAALICDSDLQPDPRLFTRAAQGAVSLGDLGLADRLAEAAIRAGGGIEAHFTRADVLSWLGRGAEADAVLAALDDHDLGDRDRARAACLRAMNKLWTLADPDGAKELIDRASGTVAQSARGCVDAFLAQYWAVMGRPDAAMTAAADLALDRLPGVVATVAACAIVVAAGDAGRTSDARAAAERGYAAATAHADAAHMRFSVADVEVGALVLAGRVTDAVELADTLHRHAADLPGIPRHAGAALAGRAALAAGDLDSACALLEPAVLALASPQGNASWAHRYGVPCATAFVLRGRPDDARRALAAIDARGYPSWRFLDYELAVARAWVSAVSGAVTEAVATVLTAAEAAHEHGQLAAEVWCLQVATQFGHRGCGPRLHALAEVVEGPRAAAAARLAHAHEAGDGAELRSASADFERMGDSIAAVDAAALAAIAYRRRDRRGSALGCSTRAEELAGRCRLVSTPTLARAVEELPITDREREIVALLAAGLSNRDIAARLTLSVRTVESHIYNAMAKTGLSHREELAALLSPPTDR